VLNQSTPHYDVWCSTGKLPSFLNSALDGAVWLGSHPEKDHKRLLDRRLGGPTEEIRKVWRKKKLPGIEPLSSSLSLYLLSYSVSNNFPVTEKKTTLLFTEQV
jgi:hypothetical protein